MAVIEFDTTTSTKSYVPPLVKINGVELPDFCVCISPLVIENDELYIDIRYRVTDVILNGKHEDIDELKHQVARWQEERERL